METTTPVIQGARCRVPNWNLNPPTQLECKRNRAKEKKENAQREWEKRKSTSAESRLKKKTFKIQDIVVLVPLPQ